MCGRSATPQVGPDTIWAVGSVRRAALSPYLFLAVTGLGTASGAWAVDLPTCPRNTQIHGAPPPTGSEVYCASNAKDGGEVKTGPYRRWHTVDQLKESGDYRDDHKQGLWTEWDIFGNKINQGKYDKGKRAGIWAEWISPNAAELVVYENGQPLDDAVPPSVWRDLTPTWESDPANLCGAFQRGKEALPGQGQLESPRKPRLRRAQASLENCLSEARRRGEERVRSATTRPISEIVAIPANKRLPEERARLDREGEARQSEHAAEIRRRHHDPKWMRVTLSGLLCVEMLVRRSFFEDIAAEKRKGRIAGVVSSSKLYGLAGAVIEWNGKIDEVKTALHRLKITPLPCSDPMVRRVGACLPTDDEVIPDSCLTADVRQYTELGPPVVGASLDFDDSAD
jgi:antitoxin component YwqK of YwqJK toxin-antitoxin module